VAGFRKEHFAMARLNDLVNGLHRRGCWTLCFVQDGQITDVPLWIPDEAGRIVPLFSLAQLADEFWGRLRNWGQGQRQLLAGERRWMPEDLAAELLQGARALEQLQQQFPGEEFAVVHLSKDELRIWLDKVAGQGARGFVVDPHDKLAQEQTSLERLRTILMEGDK
jgi:hypothetical protein